MSERTLILASASPQREQLLRNLGVEFTVQPSDLDESLCPETDPAARSVELARQKAAAIAELQPDAYVIGCDTLVVSSQGDLFEKPVDEADARRMLGGLSSAACTVHSGLCVLNPDGESAYDLSSSQVHFKPLSEEEVDWWMSTKLWQGRSGSFQIDGPGQLMIEKIEGDFSSVVGLPVYLLGELMKQVGWDLLRE